MPIKFISLNDKFIKIMKEKGYEAYLMDIENYKIERKTYYMSPANTLCFMDGGIDYVLSRKIFPNIEKIVKMYLLVLSKKYNLFTLLGRAYLPIGSSLIIDYDLNRSIIISPTMLLPQDISTTQNAYYSIQAVLYNILINKNENIDDVDIIITSICCGYGKMNEEESAKQIINGIKDYREYKPKKKGENYIINEIDLMTQPKYYQNTEWIKLKPEEIIKVQNK